MRIASVIALLIVTAGSLKSAAEPVKRDIVLYKHEARYSAFPSLTKGPEDRLWVRFGWNTTRSHYGKAAGGQTGGISLFSPDRGETWHQSGEDSQYQAPPEHLSGLLLSDGTIIRVGPRMHEVLPGEKKDELVSRGIAVKQWPDGHISASYRVIMHRKRLGSDGWETREVKLPPFASMGGFGRGCVLPDDTILKPVYGILSPDQPVDGSWVLRSADQGDTWELVTIAYDGLRDLNEAELLCLPGGRVIAIIRNEPYSTKLPPHEQGFLWQTHSDDGGRTWTGPRRTAMWGYPPHLLLTRDGDVLSTYGYRRRPYGVRACFSHDGGNTWDVEHEVILRSDALPDGPGPGKGHPGDLGYPKSAELSDGSLFTAYYITLGDGVTHVAATKWSRDYLGPQELPRGPAAVPKPDPTLAPEHVISETRLKDGLSGDHAWYLNSGPGKAGDYPNGSTAPGRETDLAFKVYAEVGPLPMRELEIGN